MVVQLGRIGVDPVFREVSAADGQRVERAGLHDDDALVVRQLRDDGLLARARSPEAQVAVDQQFGRQPVRARRNRHRQGASGGGTDLLRRGNRDRQVVRRLLNRVKRILAATRLGDERLGHARREDPHRTDERLDLVQRQSLRRPHRNRIAAGLIVGVHNRGLRHGLRRAVAEIPFVRRVLNRLAAVDERRGERALRPLRRDRTVNLERHGRTVQHRIELVAPDVVFRHAVQVAVDRTHPVLEVPRQLGRTDVTSRVNARRSPLKPEVAARLVGKKRIKANDVVRRLRLAARIGRQVAVVKERARVRVRRIRHGAVVGERIAPDNAVAENPFCNLDTRRRLLRDVVDDRVVVHVLVGPPLLAQAAAVAARRRIVGDEAVVDVAADKDGHARALAVARVVGDDRIAKRSVPEVDAAAAADVAAAVAHEAVRHQGVAVVIGRDARTQPRLRTPPVRHGDVLDDAVRQHRSARRRQQDAVSEVVSRRIDANRRILRQSLRPCRAAHGQRRHRAVRDDERAVIRCRLNNRLLASRRSFHANAGIDDDLPFQPVRTRRDLDCHRCVACNGQLTCLGNLGCKIVTLGDGNSCSNGGSRTHDQRHDNGKLQRFHEFFSSSS